MPYHRRIAMYVLEVLKLREKQINLEKIELIRSNVRVNYVLLEMKEVILNLLQFEYDLNLKIQHLDVTKEQDIVFNDYVLHLCQKQFILYKDVHVPRNDPESSYYGATKCSKIKKAIN